MYLEIRTVLETLIESLSGSSLRKASVVSPLGGPFRCTDITGCPLLLETNYFPDKTETVGVSGVLCTSWSPLQLA